MLDEISLEKILFLDIETVPQYPDYNLLPDNFKKLWDKKASQLAKNDETPEEIYPKAGIYAEFGKIIAISIGYIRRNNDELNLIIKSISGDVEHDILVKINKLLDDYFNTESHFLCAHNGKEFDFPYIARRSLINGVKIANILNTPGAKPWQIRHLDTLELWRFGDYKHWTSLELLTTIFDIPSPKGDIDGSQVYKVYWQDKDLQRIAKYCQNDVIAVAQIFMKFSSRELIKEENIIFK